MSGGSSSPLDGVKSATPQKGTSLPQRGVAVGSVSRQSLENRGDHFRPHAFTTYLDSGSFADVHLVCNGREFLAHRVILSYGSDYFRAMFSSGWRETAQDVVELKFDDSANVFPNVLQYLYSGFIEITVENVLPMLEAANVFFITSLKSRCASFLLSGINTSNVFKLCQDAAAHNVPEVEEKCVALIAENFAKLSKEGRDGFWSLTTEQLRCLLQRDDICSDSEGQVFDLLLEYLRLHDELEDETIQDLMGCIRFAFLSCQEIMDVMNDVRIPRNSLIDALMFRLSMYEGVRKDPNIFRSRRFMPRSMKGRLVWRVENVSHPHHNPVYSNEFRDAFDHRWLVLMDAHGYRERGFLSVFLVVPDEEVSNLPRTAQFRVTMVNQRSVLDSVSIELTYAFSAPNETRYGCLRFMELSRLKDPSAGFVVDDSFVCEVQVDSRDTGL